MRLIGALLFFLCTSAFAQKLEITPVNIERGSANIFRIVLRANPEKPIAALQWDVVYQDGLKIEPSGVVPGTATERSGKSVTCARRPSVDGKSALRCMLAGGVQAIAAGAIAIVRFEAAKDAPKGERFIDLTDIVGVSPKPESVSIEKTRTAMNVR
jgi:hypothetical protein